MDGDTEKSLEASLLASSGLLMSLVLSGEGPRQRSWETVTVSNHILSVKVRTPGCPHPPQCGLSAMGLAVPTTSCHTPGPTGNLPPTSRPHQKRAREEPSLLTR